MFILSPGYETEFMNLNSAATEARESQRQDAMKKIEARKVKGIPESEDTDYDEAKRCLLEAASEAEAGRDSGIYEKIEEMRDYMGGLTTVVPPFEAADDTDGLTVKLRLMGRAAYQAASTKAIIALGQGDWSGVKEFLSLAVVEVKGFDVEGDELKDVELWEAGDLLGTLYLVATHFQKIDYKGKKLFGSPQP